MPALRSSRLLPCVALVLASQLAACTTLLDGDVRNTGEDGGAGVDAAPMECVTNADCDDALFCTGVERCALDEGGVGRCVDGPRPCEGGGCFEGGDRCQEPCTTDADGDGFLSEACIGGDDCDDGNRDAHPLGEERCDASGVDEDCDPDTLGSRAEDRDNDRFWGPECCNGTVCGSDCNDLAAEIAPDIETDGCNGVDDDCDGELDEDAESLTPYFPDCDLDGYGDPMATVESCAVPAASPSGCGTPPGAWVGVASDCDDQDATIAPGVVELCDGLDNDCDEEIDESDAVCPTLADATATCTSSGCQYSCADPNRLECDGVSPGCEVDRRTARLHCGSCGAECDYRCADGGCLAPTDLDLGHSHTCARLSDGSLDCWGDGDMGRLGLGGSGVSDQASPARVMSSGAPLTLVTQVAAGARHTCALRSDGLVWCWGANGRGQLGATSPLSSNEPLQVAGLVNVTQVAVGDDFSCALLLDMTVRCWGENDRGQLGRGGLGDPQPVPAAVLSLSDVVAITAGAAFACAALSSGDVYCWGANNRQQLGSTDATSSQSPNPVEVGLGGQAARLDSRGQVAAGAEHACAILTDGDVRCWGANDDGQLGTDAFTESRTPTSVGPARGSGERFVAIAAGGAAAMGAHTCGVVEDSTAGRRLYCWGSNAAGQLGRGFISASIKSPAEVPTSFGAVSQIAVGASHTCVLTTSLGLWCWGANTSGQLGVGTRVGSASPVEVFAP